MAENLNSPLVSIIMPCYNASQFIKESIESVLSQTYENWELIIVDDGSTDDTVAEIKAWLEKDSRIRYYYQENGKQGKARNLGISKSQGNYLAFLDADDLWLPQKLDIQIKQIRDKNVDLVFSDSYYFDGKEVTDVSNKMNIVETFYTIKDLALFLSGNRIPILTVLVKRKVIKNVGGFSEKLEIQNVEDYHLWLKLLLSNVTFYSSEFVFAKYRVHPDSATSNDKLAMDKIPAAFFDLLQRYPGSSGEIKKELKLKFKLIYKNNLFTKSEMSSWITKNTMFLSKMNLKYFYLFLNFIVPTKVTKRFLIHILND